MDLQDAFSVQRAPGWKKRLAKLGFALFLKMDRKQNWSGELPFYLFCCEGCGQLVTDYPHGFPENQRLVCPECGFRRSFVSLGVRLALFASLVSLIVRVRHLPKNRSG